MSARDDLLQLPEIIRFADLVRVLGATQEGAKQLVYRWKKRDLVRPLGPRAGIYFNLVRRPDWEALLPMAVDLALPAVVLIGPTVLHHHGWTNQIPRTLHVATPCSRTSPALTGVTVHERPRSWYARFRPAEVGLPLYGLPSLSPLQALRDGEEHLAAGLDPDDIDAFAMDDWMEANATNPQLTRGVEPTRKRKPSA